MCDGESVLLEGHQDGFMVNLAASFEEVKIEVTCSSETLAVRIDDKVLLTGLNLSARKVRDTPCLVPYIGLGSMMIVVVAIFAQDRSVF